MYPAQRCIEKRKAGLGGFLGKTYNEFYTEHVHVGNRVTLHMRELERVVNTLGNGQKVYGEWTTVREWTDTVN